MAEAQTSSTAAYKLIPRAKLLPSPKNPRKSFVQIDELAQSIKENGLLEPLLVRPWGEDFEVVAGERRLRAAAKARLEEVPCLVRDMDDATARKIQMHENLDRQDLNALEEADAYAELQKDFGWSVEQLGAEFGRKPRTIWAALQLRHLGKAARQVMLEGRLSASVGLLVARIPGEDLQQQAVALLVPKDHDAVSYRVALELIQRNFMLPLDRAEFDTTDATLVEKAGPCTKCQKRTGNQRELFAEVKSADVCTDPACFRSKTDALVALKFKKAEEQGGKVLRGKAAEKVFDKFGNVRENSGFILATGGYQHVPGRGYTDVSALLKKSPNVERVLVQEPRDGKAIELVPVKALPKPKPKKAPASTSAPRTPAKETPEQKAKRIEEEKEREEIDANARRIVGDMLKRVEQKLDKPALLLMAERAAKDSGADFDLLKLQTGKDPAHTGIDKFRKSFPKMSEQQLRGVVFGLVVCASNYDVTDSKTGLEPHVAAAAKALRIVLDRPKKPAAAAPAKKPSKHGKKIRL